MSDFVEQCRQEWSRLGVPDSLAEEMANDLAVDLREADSEGLSAEQYLGTSALDPRSFATSWAVERGIIPEPPNPGGAYRKPRFLVGFTVLSAIVLIITALLLVTGEPKLALVASRVTSQGITSRRVLHATSASTPVEWILLVLAIVTLSFATMLWSNWHRSRPTPSAQ